MKLRILVLLVLFISTLVAQNHSYILSHDGLVDQRAQIKMNQIAEEIKLKLNINLYLYVTKNNNITEQYGAERDNRSREFENKVLDLIDTKNNYVVLILAIDQKWLNIRMSSELKDIIDIKDIREYLRPLLASKDKNTLSAKISAACFNGYAQIADVLAEDKGIELISSIGSEGKIAGTIWKVFMYSMVLIGIISYILIIIRERKMKK